MIIHMAWVLISFFAVIGIFECILGVVRIFSLRRVRSVGGSVLRVELKGTEPHMEYLLNTLLLTASRLDLGSGETVLEIVNGGLSEESRQELLEYCKKNPGVLFTEMPEGDIIST